MRTCFHTVSGKTTSLLIICQWLLILAVVSSQDADECRNSKGKHGKCVPISLCPDLLNLAQRTVISTRDKAYLDANICDQVENYVCCARSTTSTKDSKMTLPDVDECGFGDATGRIIGGKETDLGQYRWMVVIERFGEVICGGALINTLYVLTAAHCFNAEQIAENLVLRLGEHNLLTDPDCDPYSSYCNPPVIFANVSQIIAHPKYRREGNDIALLKLTAPIRYTNHVLPICLPVLPAQQEEFISELAYAAGWGNNGTGEAMSPVKMHVKLMITNTAECRRLFIRTSPSSMHVCAKAADGVGDTCGGDSGGPLMIQIEGNWFHVGVVNFGAPCETSHPAVYARTSHYIDWIKDNLIE